MIRMLEAGIRDVGDVDPNRFCVIVRDVVVSGSPPTKLRASVLVRFLPAGEPFCCGEPACYSPVFSDEGAVELGDELRRSMKLQHTVSVDLCVDVEYYDGISFTGFREHANRPHGNRRTTAD